MSAADVDAQLAAVLVVGVLIAFVSVGVSGRANPPPVPRGRPLLLSPRRPRLRRRACNQPLKSHRSPRQARQPSEMSAAFLPSSGDAQYITILDEPEPGHLVGRLRLPLPVATVDGIFAFQQFSSASAPGRPCRVADWPISVRFARGRQPSLHGRKRNAPGSANHSRRAEAGRARLPASRSYGRRIEQQGELTINIRIGPNRQLQGNDGIPGMGGRIDSSASRRSTAHKGATTTAAGTWARWPLPRDPARTRPTASTPMPAATREELIYLLEEWRDGRLAPENVHHACP